LRYLDLLGVGAEVRQRAFRIDGAIIAGAEGEGVELRGDHETAILLRSSFDELLVREAERRGAELREGVRVRRIESHNGQLGVQTDQGTIEADVVIDCSGATGGFDRARRRPQKAVSLDGTLHTIMGWYEGVQGTSDVVELFFDRELKPHYGWVFPESPRRVNIGLCYAPGSGSNARERFQSFLERRLGPRLKGADLTGSWIGHPVNVSSVPRGLTAPGVLRAGEAGWLADFATAEGIYHALVSGNIAAEHVAELASRGWRRDLNANAYQSKVLKALGPRMLGGRVLMSALKGPVLDAALRFRSSRATREVLRKAFSGLYHG
jgi:flavin-dependent dehydrogenase